MIDEFYYVSADRISPEFPIPVMVSAKEGPQIVEPGGAANVLNQMKFWNVDAELLAFQDYNAKKVQICLPYGHFIPRKKRYYSGDFALFRHDVESPNYGLTDDQLIAMQKNLVEKFKRKKPALTILSDYNKGTFVNVGFDVIKPLLWHTHPTLVDPKKGPLSKWRGCTYIKPNASEARALTGCSDWKEQCDVIRKETDCEGVIITQSGSGVVGWHGDYFEHRTSKTVTASSVVGAGDCFMAFLAMGLAQGFALKDAVAIAFDAGLIYVQRKHNQPVSPEDFIPPSKFVIPELLLYRQFKLAFTNGCFDILHSGHLETFKFAKSKADKLVVAVNSDESVKKQNKSHGLVNDLESRKNMLAALECVDFVVEFNEDTPYNLIQAIKPDVLVKGGDHPNPVGADLVPEVYLVPLVPNVSTTNIINKIKQS